MTILANMSPAQLAEFNAAMLLSGGDGVARAGLASRPTTYVTFGDSRFDQDYAGTSGNAAKSVVRGTAYWVTLLSRGGFFNPQELNYGIASQKASQFAARAAANAADALAKLGTPGLVLISDPTNSYDAEDPIPYMDVVFKAFSSLGFQIGTWNPTPRGDGTTNTLTSDGLKRQNQYRRWLLANRQRQKLIIIDADALLADPAQTGFRPKAGPISGTDYLHFWPPGARIMAQKILDQIGKQYFPVSPLVSANGDSYDAVLSPNGNLTNNPRMNGTAGANSGLGGATSFTGQVATGYFLGGINLAGVTVVSSVVNNRQRIVISGTPTVSNPQVRFEQILGNAKLVEGDRLQASCSVDTGTLAGVEGISMNNQIIDAGGSHSTTWGVNVLGVELGADPIVDGGLVTPVNTVGASPTGHTLAMIVQLRQNVAVSATVEFGCCGEYKML
jgi:hypothetical protein